MITRLCKTHYLHFMRLVVSRDFKVMYRQPESAFGALDFQGRGFIAPEEFRFGSKFTSEDTAEFL